VLKLAVLVGPTAAGKTALAVEAAERAGAEIVGADSQQVYRYFDIGTAKPTAEERARVPHHLVDVAEPHEQFDAGRYAEEAGRAIAGIAGRGRRALVVGGTGLWLRALLKGLIAAPGRDAELRAQLRALPLDELRARLADADPEAAARIRPGDRMRIERALEVHALTGKPISAFWARHRFAEPRYEARVWGVTPPREELYRRIDERARAWFAGPLLDEMRSLVERGYAGARPMRLMGYRQALGAVRGELSAEAACADAAREMRRYAKRQLTWFRADAEVAWLPWPPDAAAFARELEAFFAAAEQAEAHA
jgi:tRNA dimethylallyltransferase